MTATPFASDIDAWLDGLCAEDRAELIGRLSRPAGNADRSSRVRSRRRRTLAVLMVSCALLLPWIVLLAVRLPHSYRAVHWDATWVGFDSILLIMLATTVLLAWRRQQITLLAAFGTGVLLACDAWFDVLTANHHDLGYSIFFAVAVELPLAALLIRTSWLMLLHSTRFLDPAAPRSLWRATLPAEFTAPRM